MGKILVGKGGCRLRRRKEDEEGIRGVPGRRKEGRTGDDSEAANPLSEIREMLWESIRTRLWYAN
jgi:hypothetical protein